MKSIVNDLKEASRKADVILNCEYKNLQDSDNILIQKVLLETDLDSVINICTSGKISKEIITSNLSSRIREVVEDEIIKNNPIFDNSYDTFKNKLVRFIYNTEIKSNLDITDKISIDGLNNTKTTLYSLYKKSSNTSELLDFVDTSPNNDLKRCFSLLTKSYDPLKAEKIIDKIQDKLLFEYRSSLDLIKEVVIGILENSSEDEIIDILHA